MCKIKSITGAPLREYCKTDFNVNAIRYAADNKQAGEKFRFTGTAAKGYNETTEEGKGIEFSVTYKDDTRLSVVRVDTGEEFCVTYGEKAPKTPARIKTKKSEPNEPQAATNEPQAQVNEPQANEPTTTKEEKQNMQTQAQATTGNANNTNNVAGEINALLGNFGAMLADKLNAMNQQTTGDAISRADIAEIVRDELEKGLTHKIQVNEGEPVKIGGLLHESFDAAFMWCKNKVPVYLYGEAGTGKNVLAKQIADALNLPFYYAGALQQKYELEGFVNAAGEYQETDFYKAFTGGGVFLFDEIDGTAAEVLVAFNAALANRYYNFPKHGRTQAHEDFVVIAAGNTTGHGADSTYCGRFQLDASTLDRFAYIELNYDKRIELQAAGGDEELLEFAHAIRKEIARQNLTYTFSTRAIQRVALAKACNVNEYTALRMAACGAWAYDDIKLLQSNLQGEGLYFNAFRLL